MSRRSPAPAPRSRSTHKATAAPAGQKTARHFAIVGAGLAGIVCARTLVQAGHQVTVFDQADQVGGRMATHQSAFGSFDAGAQYFTVRDARFAEALDTVPGVFRPWSATSVRILDAAGRVAAPSLPPSEAHWVASPSMDALARAWALPLVQAGQLQLDTHVKRIERDPLHTQGWQLRTESSDGASHVFAGFDAVLLAHPATPAHALLATSHVATDILEPLAEVFMDPCWTLMLAFPHAVQPGLTTLGPQWNAARSTHHRIAWLARESSKPGRSSIERWTVQASTAWSHEHMDDDAPRVQAKLLKAFSEITGIRAEPSYAQVHLWRYAQTTQALEATHLWDAQAGIGACGDWCLGHRLEDAFVSGLELALAVA